jgi:hypothetical protein
MGFFCKYNECVVAFVIVVFVFVVFVVVGFEGLIDKANEYTAISITSATCLRPSALGIRKLSSK